MPCWALLIFVLAMLVPGSDQLLTSFASSHGLSINQYKRVYQHGNALPLEKKVSIAVEYLPSLTGAKGHNGNGTAAMVICLCTRVESVRPDANERRGKKKVGGGLARPRIV